MESGIEELNQMEMNSGKLWMEAWIGIVGLVICSVVDVWRQNSAVKK